MPAVYTTGFARAFERIAEAAVVDGIDPCAELPDLVMRVVAQARILNPDAWPVEIDALCRQLRMRLAWVSVKDRVLVGRERRRFRREVYLQGINLLQFAKDDAEYD